MPVIYIAAIDALEIIRQAPQLPHSHRMFACAGKFLVSDGVGAYDIFVEL